MQVNEAFPVRPLVEVTAAVTALSAAPIGPLQLTPGALTQLTVPPLQGEGEFVPPPAGTQLGMGVLTDQSMPGGQENPLGAGAPSAA